MEVDTVEGLVLGITVAGFATKAGDLLADVLIGQRLRGDDFVASVQEFQRRYIGAPQKAICTAVMNAFESYQRYLRQAGHEFFPLPRSYEDENRR
jgi:hypothetical protein